MLNIFLLLFLSFSCSLVCVTNPLSQLTPIFQAEARQNCKALDMYMNIATVFWNTYTVCITHSTWYLLITWKYRMYFVVQTGAQHHYKRPIIYLYAHNTDNLPLNRMLLTWKIDVARKWENDWNDDKPWKLTKFFVFLFSKFMAEFLFFNG